MNDDADNGFLQSRWFAFILAAAFYGLITPVAVLLRLLGVDLLRLKRPAAESYWIVRGEARRIEFRR